MITKQSVQGRYPTKPLGEIVTFLDHKRRPVKEAERKPGPYPYYGANGKQGDIDNYLFDEDLILLAEDGGHFHQPDRGIAYRISGKSWVNNHAHVIRAGSEIDTRFLCRVLENYDVGPYISGTTRGKLTKGQAEKIQIPLPPLTEQWRIAAILEEADEIRHTWRQVCNAYERLRRAVFDDMFGDLSKIPRTTNFSDIAHIQQSLVDPKTQEYKSKLHVGPEHIEGGAGIIDWSRVQSAEKDNVISGKNAFDDSVVIYSKIRPSLNKVAMPDREGICSADMYVVSPRSGKSNKYFIHALLMGRDFIRYAETVSNRANIPKLNRAEVEGYRFACPELEQQALFEKRMRVVDTEFRSSKDARQYADALFTALQHRAFRGEL